MRVVTCRLWSAGVALLLLIASVARAQQPAIHTDAKVDRTEIALAQSVRVTLAIEGPAPLRVDLPKTLLTADANTAWRIRPDPPASKPEVKTAGPGRERWQQTYRLDPYLPSDALRASFNPVTVNGQQVTWDPVTVKVTKTVGDVATTPPRPPTGTEEPPPPPEKTDHNTFPVWAAVMVGLACVAVVGAIVFRARKAKPVPPHEWALARLAKLENKNGAEAVEQIAATLRSFVERRFAIPATKLTTAELTAAALDQGWPVEQTEPLRTILDECDRAKFAGDLPDEDGCRRLVRLAVDWVNHVSRPAEPR
jgi:hypothetical protein